MASVMAFNREMGLRSKPEQKCDFGFDMNPTDACIRAYRLARVLYPGSSKNPYDCTKTVGRSGGKAED